VNATAVRSKIGEWLPALIVFVAAIAVWHFSIVVFHIEKFLLPKPGAIISAFWTQRSVLWSAGWLTLKEALGGLAIG
jgi:ABC-type nitrate/sulfonate/bicarbonate transport system permease component